MKALKLDVINGQVRHVKHLVECLQLTHSTQHYFKAVQWVSALSLMRNQAGKGTADAQHWRCSVRTGYKQTMATHRLPDIETPSCH